MCSPPPSSQSGCGQEVRLGFNFPLLVKATMWLLYYVTFKVLLIVVLNIYDIAFLYFTIIDEDECHVDNGGCEFGCNNTEASYYCMCRSGYILAADRHSCEDIDECRTLAHHCPGKHS